LGERWVFNPGRIWRLEGGKKFFESSQNFGFPLGVCPNEFGVRGF